MKFTQIALIALVLAVSDAKRLRHGRQPLKWTEERECCKCPYDPNHKVIVGRCDTNGHNTAQTTTDAEWRQCHLPDTRCCPCPMEN